jgi:hypothetical protein
MAKAHVAFGRHFEIFKPYMHIGLKQIFFSEEKHFRYSNPPTI